jgi:iron(II)-dependent oxidoreductase
MGTDAVLSYMAEVRRRSTFVLGEVDLSPSSDRLNADGFVWEMVIQHERQHNETMLQTLQFAEPGVYRPDRAALPGVAAEGPELVEVPAGRVEVGAGHGGFAYDNERPRHVVELDAGRIDRTPVTNAAFAEFIEAGGYRRRGLWSAAGWDWRVRERAEGPLYWSGREHRSFDRVAPVDGAQPVMHVSWYEADAYARWRGKRLPSEAEWEAAAGAARYPWGDAAPSGEHANLGGLAFGPAAAGAYPAGAAPCGALGLIGDVWEWTNTEFTGYTGFEAFPYDGYSKTFFDRGYGVLRGGSWATGNGAVRTSFRNWDLLDRRQIFSGFRCVERRG